MVLRGILEYGRGNDMRVEKLHNKELHDRCCSVNIIRIVKSWG
jgi:hypothetical protein